MRNIAIIGSNAMNVAFIDFQHPAVTPNDLDIVGRYDDVVAYMKHIALTTGKKLVSIMPLAGGKKLVGKARDAEGKFFMIEAEIAWAGSLAEELLNHCFADSALTYADDDFMLYHANLDLLYTLKMSHRYLRNSPHFAKTREHILLMRKLGAIIPEHLEDFFKRREAATYDYGHPKLNVSKKDFFSGDGVKYVYDHDTIHEAVKIGERPAYTYFAEGEVKSSKKKFFAMEPHIRLRATVEESMVLAIERSLVPFPGVKTPDEAFEMALQKVCTSITSGWFREYSWENYDDAMELFNYHQSKNCYFDIFNVKKELGIVKPFRSHGDLYA